MKARNRTHRSALSLALLGLVALMAPGCDQEDPADHNSQCLDLPVCEDGETLSHDACDHNEPGCRQETLCDSFTHAVAAEEPFTIYCRPAEMCDAHPTCEGGEAESNTPCVDGETCRIEAVCGGTIYCRPEANCGAIPMCMDNEDESQEPCADDETDCHAETQCGSTIYCR